MKVTASSPQRPAVDADDHQECVFFGTRRGVAVPSRCGVIFFAYPTLSGSEGTVVTGFRSLGRCPGVFMRIPHPKPLARVLGTAPGVFVRMPTPNRIDCSIGPSRTSSRSGHPRQIEMSSLTSCSGRPREGSRCGVIVRRDMMMMPAH